MLNMLTKISFSKEKMEAKERKHEIHKKARDFIDIGLKDYDLEEQTLLANLIVRNLREARLVEERELKHRLTKVQADLTNYGIEKERED